MQVQTTKTLAKTYDCWTKKQTTMLRRTPKLLKKIKEKNFERSSGFPSCAGLLKNHSIQSYVILFHFQKYWLSIDISHCFFFNVKTSSFRLIYLPRTTTIDRWYVNVAVGDFLGIRMMWSYSFHTSFYSALIVK